MFKTSTLLRLTGAAALLAGSAHAVSAVPTLTVSGTFASAPYFQSAVSPTFLNVNTLNGKPFELELGFLGMPVYLGSEELDDLPGEFIHSWTPGAIQYTFKVGGSPLYSGVSTFTFAEALDDVFVPPGFLAALPPGEFLPPLIQDGGTYDDVILDVSGIPLGCVGSSTMCNQPGEVFEGVMLTFEYVWDTASKNAIAMLPGNPAALPADFFTGGQGVVGLSVYHWDGLNGEEIAVHGGLTSNVVLAMPVPEADTWGMMLAGLGLVGWAAMRRRAA